MDRALIQPRRIARNYFSLLVDRRFVGPAALMGLVLGGLYTLPSLLPFVLIERIGLTPIQYALVMIVQTGALLVWQSAGRAIVAAHQRAQGSCPAASRSSQSRHGIRRGAAVPTPHLLVVRDPRSMVWVFGLPFVTPGTMTSALSYFPKIAGAASSLIGFMQMGGGFVGSALAATFFGDPVAAVDTLLPVIALLAGLTYFLLPPPSSLDLEELTSGRAEGASLPVSILLPFCPTMRATS